MDTSIKSIRLVSNNICFRPEPKKTQEVEQHLTISSSGNIWFSARNYGQYTERKGVSRSRRLNIGKWKASHLINLLSQLSEDADYVTDCGDFDLYFRHEDGYIRHIYGSLVGGIDSVNYGQTVSLTKLVRRYIPIRSLWVFDGRKSPDYEGKKAIHLFAKKWIKTLSDASDNPQIKYDFEEHFGNDCAALGFIMDSGTEFVRLYPQCSDPYNGELEKIIPDIEDIDLLGSAIISLWRQKTHWNYSCDLYPKDISLYSLILGQMMILTAKAN